MNTFLSRKHKKIQRQVYAFPCCMQNEYLIILLHFFSFRPDCNALDACVGGYCQAGSLDPLPLSFPQFERRLWRNEMHQVMCLCPRSHQDEAARPLGDESLILLLTWQTLEVWSQWMLTTNNTISRKYAFEAGFLDSCGLFPVFVLLISYTISFCLGSLFCFGYL